MRALSLPLGLAAGSADDNCTAGAPQRILRLGSQGGRAIMKLFAYGTVKLPGLPGRWLHQAALGLACQLFFIVQRNAIITIFAYTCNQGGGNTVGYGMVIACQCIG